MQIRVTNPATGEVIKEYELMNDKQVARRLTAADKAFQAWQTQAVCHRTDCLSRLATLLEKESAKHARLMALEMGKPVHQGLAEIDACICSCRQLADKAEGILSPEIHGLDQKRYASITKPFGIIFGVTSWNFPFWQVLRFTVPAMMAGNAVLLKHASAVPGTSLAIENLIRRSGFPSTLFQILRISRIQVNSITDDPRVKAIILAGSKRTGQSVIKQAGGLISKNAFELCGSDPHIILDDAEIDKTVDACVSGCLLNSGQSGATTKRLIVSAGIRAAFEKQLVRKMKQVKVGDPVNADVHVGPLACKDFQDTLDLQVRRSVDKGARCLLGGKVAKGNGFFYPPTVLTDVCRGMPVYHNETFGPVAIVIPVADETEAIRLANETNYGVGATVFTRNISRGVEIAAQHLHAGHCFINALVRPDAGLPFCGVDERVNGHDSSQHYGMEQFFQTKTIHVC